jgi:nicotinamide-nucleotide amidase
VRAHDHATVVIKALKRRGLTLSTAESITGGGLAEALTSVSGSSAVFQGGFITYSDVSKTKFLGVARRVLNKHTAVSEEVAIAMAQSARAQFKTDFAISTTGVAGPGRAYGQKVGTVWIAIDSKLGTSTVQLALAGDRAQIRHATLESALAAFTRILIP